MVDTIPLKKGSSPSSYLGFFRLPFPFALSRAAASLFFFARASSPSREALGVRSPPLGVRSLGPSRCPSVEEAILVGSTFKLLTTMLTSKSARVIPTHCKCNLVIGHLTFLSFVTFIVLIGYMATRETANPLLLNAMLGSKDEGS